MEIRAPRKFELAGKLDPAAIQRAISTARDEQKHFDLRTARAFA
jgi:hypothetical protein